MPICQLAGEKAELMYSPQESLPPTLVIRTDMRVLVGAHDWSASAIGPLDGWPQSLRTAVDLVLGSPLAMLVLWGPDLVQIYNDAYAVIAGARHPRALGQPTRDCWPETWQSNAPIYAAVMAGEARCFPGQLLVVERGGIITDAWFDLTYSPLHDKSGATTGVLVIFIETTDRTLADRRMVAQVKRQRRLFEQAPGFIAVVNGPNHIFEFVNEAYVRLTGRQDYVGKPVREAFPDLEGQGFFELLDQVYATGNRSVASAIPIRFQPTPHEPPKNLLLDFIYEPIIDEAGRVTGIFCQGYDVTEACHAQEALRKAEALAERTAERDRVWRNSLDVLVVADADGVFLAASPAWTRVLGHDVLEVVGRSFRDFVWDEDVDETSQAIVSASTGIDVNGFENRYRHKDGSLRLLAWRTSAEDGLIYGYGRDVTAERAQADELAKRVAERDRLWSTNPMLFAIAAYDSTILEVNPAWTKLLGWTPEDLIGRS